MPCQSPIFNNGESGLTVQKPTDTSGHICLLLLTPWAEYAIKTLSNWLLLLYITLAIRTVNRAHNKLFEYAMEDFILISLHHPRHLNQGV